LTPEQETFPSAETLLVDVADCESENKCPYQTQDNLAVSVHNIFRSNIGGLNTPPFYKVEAFVDVFEFLHPQLWFGGIATKGFVSKDFEEVDQGNLCVL
jgi:hypothetical protein